MKKHHIPRIEALESRIAPAVTIVNAHTATYTDVDGDHVALTVSTGTLTAANFTMYSSFGDLGEGIKLLDLHSGGFDGANVTVKVDKVDTGDGLANVGFIDSTGHDLGNVKVAGDLARINAGDDTGTTPAIKLLAVRSMGQVNLESQNLSGNLESDIHGDIKSMTVQGNMVGAYLNVTGFGLNGELHATIASLTINGSLIGTGDDHGGEITTTGHITNMKVRLDVRGGDGLNAGSINVGTTCNTLQVGGSLVGGKGMGSGSLNGYGGAVSVSVGQNLIGGNGELSGSVYGFFKINKLTIGGSLLGGAGTESGSVEMNDFGVDVIKIAHDVRGGSGLRSGYIYLQDAKLIAIGGSLVGGTGDESGDVISYFKGLTIGGDFIGGSVEGSASLDHSGYIAGAGGGTIIINGSIIAGFDHSSGPLTNSAEIQAGTDGLAVIVKGSVVGHDDIGQGASRVRFVSAGGFGHAVQTVFSRISVGGNFEYADILAGYDLSVSPPARSFHAKVGPVLVGGDWIASNLVVEVQNLGTDGAFGGAGSNSDDRDFGNSHDMLSPDQNPGDSVKPEITSITIIGHVFGSTNNHTDHFGFVSQVIGPVKIGGQTIAVPTNTTPKMISITLDTTIHLVVPLT